MGKCFCFVFVLALLCPLYIAGQADIKISRKEFRKSKPGFDDAWKHVKKGNLYFRMKGSYFRDACDEYMKALHYDTTCAALNYKTGATALFSDKKDEAYSYLLNAIDINPEVSDDIFFLTGVALQYAGKYSEAAGPLTSFLESKGEKAKDKISKAEKHLEECISALALLKDTLNLEISNPGPDINSASDDYSEVLSADGNTIFFASKNDFSGSPEKHEGKRTTDENILMSVRRNGTWDKAVSPGKKLTSKFCEAPLYVNDSLDTLYIYKGNKEKGNIYVSHKRAGKWDKPSKPRFRINSGESETAFTFAPSGKEIWFVRTGGKNNLGGKDIYFMRKNSRGKWSKPVNAGLSVNTRFDEESVRFSSHGDTLWFSSRGHNSMGGFDIFYSVRDSSGVLLPAVNAGYPLNTHWNELFYFPSGAAGGEFFFASDRKGGSGGYDIYAGHKKMTEPLQYEREMSLKNKTGVVASGSQVIK